MVFDSGKLKGNMAYVHTPLTRGFCSTTYPCAMRLRLCLSGKRLYLGYICMKYNDTSVCRIDIPKIDSRSDLKVNWKSQMSVFRCITDAL